MNWENIRPEDVKESIDRREVVRFESPEEAVELLGDSLNVLDKAAMSTVIHGNLDTAFNAHRVLADKLGAMMASTGKVLESRFSWEANEDEETPKPKEDPDVVVDG